MLDLIPKLSGAIDGGVCRGPGTLGASCGGIAFELHSPPGALGFQNAGIFAVRVQMPQAAVDKNTDAVAWLNDVGAPRQITL